MKFWFPWAIAAVVTAVVLLFFVVGLADGSVSSFNIALWLLILAGTIGVTTASLFLKMSGRPNLGTVVALVLALPGVLAALFMLLILVMQPRWN